MKQDLYWVKLILSVVIIMFTGIFWLKVIAMILIWGFIPNATETKN